MSIKWWTDPDKLRIWAIVERSKRTGKVGIVMTSTGGVKALKTAMGRMVLADHRNAREYEIHQFSLVPEGAYRPAPTAEGRQ